LESIEGPGRCSGRCSGGQTEMGKDLGDHGGMFDGGDDLQGTTGLGAVFHSQTTGKITPSVALHDA